MTNEIATTTTTPYEIMENVIAKGDLSKLTSEQRVTYYNKVCESIGLNPLTRPFQYISFEGKLALYASKDCTEQLRTLKGVSVTKIEKEVIGSIYVVTAYVCDHSGRTDVSTGAVDIKGVSGKNLANAYKKSETQAKRRATLSICGLGFLDESETPDVAGAKAVEVDFETGEIKQAIVEHKISADEMKMSPDFTLGINAASNLTELKDAYAKAFTFYMGRLELMTEITELKDKRKEELSNPQPLSDDTKEWLAERDAAEQGDGA